MYFLVDRTFLSGRRRTGMSVSRCVLQQASRHRAPSAVGNSYERSDVRRRERLGCPRPVHGVPSTPIRIITTRRSLRPNPSPAAHGVTLRLRFHLLWGADGLPSFDFLSVDGRLRQFLSPGGCTGVSQRNCSATTSRIPFGPSVVCRSARPCEPRPCGQLSAPSACLHLRGLTELHVCLPYRPGLASSPPDAGSHDRSLSASSFRPSAF
jgi:hypothetical protein